MQCTVQTTPIHHDIRGTRFSRRVVWSIEVKKTAIEGLLRTSSDHRQAVFTSHGVYIGMGLSFHNMWDPIQRKLAETTKTHKYEETDSNGETDRERGMGREREMGEKGGRKKGERQTDRQANR